MCLVVIFLLRGINLHSQEMIWEEMNLLNDNVKIDFSLFPTKHKWEKNKCIPVLDTPSKRNYRTIIAGGAEMEANFDGKYRIVEFGAGSGVQYFFIIDLNNGNVYEGRTSSFGIKYTTNSSMIIINPIENMFWEDGDFVPHWSFIEYIKWNGEGFISLAVINGGLYDNNLLDAKN
ncbi:MAG: hypothetical protein LBL20_01035 [Treponema sp.]|jgi:hypothetical protein|nr:hypothetical protein [Treponema sp.]